MSRIVNCTIAAVMAGSNTQAADDVLLLVFGVSYDNTLMSAKIRYWMLVLSLAGVTCKLSSSRVTLAKILPCFCHGLRQVGRWINPEAGLVVCICGNPCY